MSRDRGVEDRHILRRRQHVPRSAVEDPSDVPSGDMESAARGQGHTFDGDDRSGRRQVAYTRWLGLAFCTAGFAAIALGWQGMSEATSADAQLPYLLSGGAAGLGLIGFGVGLLVMAQLRADRIRNDRALKEVLHAIGLAARATPPPESPALKVAEPSSRPASPDATIPFSTRTAARHGATTAAEI